MTILEFLEKGCGWIYFFAWGFSFYPQVILLFKMKNSSGVSTDHEVINTVGFICYALSTCISFTSPAARKSFLQQTGAEPQIEFNDVFFACHGAVLCLISISQVLYYPPHKLPRRPITLACSFIQASVFAGIFYAIQNPVAWPFVLQYAGLVKAASSCVKHVPQVMLNFSRQSTVGFSFSSVCLDVIGGIFSLAQQAVLCIQTGSLIPFIGNIPKTLIAIESLFFDFLYMFQHLVLYTDRATHFDAIPETEKNQPNSKLDDKSKLFIDEENPPHEHTYLYGAVSQR